MPYPELKDVRERLSVQWYRSPMPPEVFRELSRKSDVKGWFQAGGHFALFLISGGLVTALWVFGQYVWMLPALFLHGTIASFMGGTACHELGHGTVFQTKWLNRFFLHLYALISWWNPYDYAASHTYHHRYTLHPDGDRENLLPLHPNVGKTFLLQMFTVNLLTLPGRTFGKGGLISTIWVTVQDALGRVGDNEIASNEWLNALHRTHPDERRKSMIWSRVQLAFHSCVAVVAIVSGLWILLPVISFAAFIANWLSYFVSLPQHCGLMENTDDFRKSTRSITLPGPVEFLYWHMNWHTEHHMFAGIPCYNLPRLHRAVRADMPEPRTLLGAWREMLMVWHAQQSDPDFAFDTPLPETARKGRAPKDQPEGASSIGDLAPEGLR